MLTTYNYLIKMERFSNYSKENILEHVNKLKNTNTKKVTNNWMGGLFTMGWCLTQKTCIKKLSRNTLDAMLGQFYAMQAGLDRYFK